MPRDFYGPSAKKEKTRLETLGSRREYVAQDAYRLIVASPRWVRIVWRQIRRGL